MHWAADNHLDRGSDPLPASTDFTSERSSKTRVNGVDSMVAGQFSPFLATTAPFTGNGARPHGATQTDPVSNTISLRAHSAPPGNVSETELSSVDATFTVVPVGSVMPNHPVFYNAGWGNSDGTFGVPLLIVQVVNNTSAYNLEAIYFNGDNDSFTYGKAFTAQETFNFALAGGDERLSTWSLRQPSL